MSLSAVIRIAHIAGGSLALLTFWLPWLTRKGARAHRTAGWLYVAAMAVVAVSGLATCALRLLDGEPSNDASSLFLAYVGVLSAANTSMGVRVIATKRRLDSSRNLWDLGLGALLLLGGVGLTVFAAANSSVLFGLFGVLGSVLAFNQLRFWLRPPQDKTAWLFEHLNNMGAACIGTVTAFLVVNWRVFGLDVPQLILWSAPGVLGGAGISAWQTYYRLRMKRPSAAAQLP